jgi:hypothetical protein
MHEEQSISNGESTRSSSSEETNGVASLVILFNIVTAGLGALYVSTRSLAVTVVAAGLVALLGLYVMFGCVHHH